VLGISVDSNEKVYRQFLERRPVAFETFRDPGGEISGDYGTFADAVAIGAPTRPPTVEEIVQSLAKPSASCIVKPMRRVYSTIRLNLPSASSESHN